MAYLVLESHGKRVLLTARNFSQEFSSLTNVYAYTCSYVYCTALNTRIAIYDHVVQNHNNEFDYKMVLLTTATYI